MKKYFTRNIRIEKRVVSDSDTIEYPPFGPETEKRFVSNADSRMRPDHNLETTKRSAHGPDTEKHRISQVSPLIRPLGSTDMRVHVLGFGGLEISDSTDENVSHLLNQNLDEGLNVIDTAECYGQSEELIGRAIGHRRDDYYLFTKCGHAAGLNLPDWHPRLLKQSIERSLQRLKTDYLDLIQLHSCSEELLRRGEVIEVLQRARDAGKVRYIGYSGDRQPALYAVQCGAFDVLQTSVNIADQEALEEIIPQARTRGMGIIAKHPIANIAWKSGQEHSRQHSLENHPRYLYAKRLKKLNYDFLDQPLEEAVGIALRFTLSVPGVDLAIVGTTKVERWQENVASLAKGALSSEQYQAIRRSWQGATYWRKRLPGGTLGWHSLS